MFISEYLLILKEKWFIDQLVCQEAKPFIANVEYRNRKSRKYFWIVLKSCLFNEFMTQYIVIVVTNKSHLIDYVTYIIIQLLHQNLFFKKSSLL